MPGAVGPWGGRKGHAGQFNRLRYAKSLSAGARRRPPTSVMLTPHDAHGPCSMQALGVYAGTPPPATAAPSASRGPQPAASACMVEDKENGECDGRSNGRAAQPRSRRALRRLPPAPAVAANTQRQHSAIPARARSYVPCTFAPTSDPAVLPTGTLPGGPQLPQSAAGGSSGKKPDGDKAPGRRVLSDVTQHYAASTKGIFIGALGAGFGAVDPALAAQATSCRQAAAAAEAAAAEAAAARVRAKRQALRTMR